MGRTASQNLRDLFTGGRSGLQSATRGFQQKRENEAAERREGREAKAFEQEQTLGRQEIRRGRLENTLLGEATSPTNVALRQKGRGLDVDAKQANIDRVKAETANTESLTTARDAGKTGKGASNFALGIDAWGKTKTSHVNRHGAGILAEAKAKVGAGAKPGEIADEVARLWSARIGLDPERLGSPGTLIEEFEAMFGDAAKLGSATILNDLVEGTMGLEGLAPPPNASPQDRASFWKNAGAAFHELLGALPGNKTPEEIAGGFQGGGGPGFDPTAALVSGARSTVDFFAGTGAPQAGGPVGPSAGFRVVAPADAVGQSPISFAPVGRLSEAELIEAGDIDGLLELLINGPNP